MSQHKHPVGKTIQPHARKHLWERHPEETPAAPTVAQAGEYQEFPRTLHKAEGATLTVHDEDEKKAALKKGWKLTPDDIDPALPQDEHKRKHKE